MLRLKINEKEKILVKQTFYTLMLPQHTIISTLSLYHTVNQIWKLAGDNSTSFNFFTKRTILAFVYSSTLFYWINGNRTMRQTENFLNNQLSKISKISKLKEKIITTANILPKIFLFAKKSSSFKQ